MRLRSWHAKLIEVFMDSRILKTSWKIKAAAIVFGLVMSLSVYVVYAAGLKFNHVVNQIGELARKNAEDRKAAEEAAREEANRKAGILPTQIYGEKPKQN